MAKCITMYNDGELDETLRVPDDTAWKLVSRGLAVYTSKEEWKAQGRKQGKGKVPQWVTS